MISEEGSGLRLAQASTGRKSGKRERLRRRYGCLPKGGEGASHGVRMDTVVGSLGRPTWYGSGAWGGVAELLCVACGCWNRAVTD